MTGIPAWVIAVVMSAFCAAAGAILLPAAQRRAVIDARIRSACAQADGFGAGAGTTAGGMAFWLRPIGALGRAVIVSGVLSAKTIRDLEETVAAAGYRTGPALYLFIGAKLSLVLGLPAIAFIAVKASGISISPTFPLATAAVIGLLLPDFIVKRIRRRYLAAVEAGLPSALDLLIICAEAGLALEAGFERVSEEFKDGIRPTANELRITANEMKILSDRRTALINMGKRTGLESMQRLGGTLAQSLKYGTPLTQALRVLATEMRQTLLTRYEARAARLPVLLTIPMILFILPCIFVVVGGPAAVQVIHVMRSR